MGPYVSGTFSVDLYFARQIVQRWGSTVTIRSQYPGTNWFQPGTTLHVWPLGGGTPYPPGPYPPEGGSIQVYFRATIVDPSTGTTFMRGRVYSFTPARLQAMANSVGRDGIVFMEQDGDTIPFFRLPQYVGRTINADQPIFAFRQRNNNGWGRNAMMSMNGV